MPDNEERLSREQMEQRIALLQGAISQHHETVRGRGRGRATFRGRGRGSYLPPHPYYTRHRPSYHQKPTPVYRNRTLVVNAATPTDSAPNGDGQGEPGEVWVTKRDRHLQLINKEVHDKAVQEMEIEKEQANALARTIPTPPKPQITRPRPTQPSKLNILCSRFTATGSCSKGKICRYTHDPEKTAICREFLAKGTCKNGQHCNLSHEPSPHRCPACVHFLRGNCTNEHCRYSHVHVNPDAPICADFAKVGYCERGDSCFERHEYECPAYSSTGSCPNPRCRLPHIDRASRLRKPTSTLSVNPTVNDLQASKVNAVSRTSPGLDEPGPLAARHDSSSPSPEQDNLNDENNFISLDVDDAQFEKQYASDSDNDEMKVE